jgi:hypothetical protein
MRLRGVEAGFKLASRNARNSKRMNSLVVAFNKKSSHKMYTWAYKCCEVDFDVVFLRLFVVLLRLFVVLLPPTMHFASATARLF